MKWCKESALTLFFSFVILSCAKENQCPGSKASCPDDSTCCRLHDGNYGCCPIKDAVCCQDSVHCCPAGYSCDIIKGVCQMGDKSKPLLKKIPAITTVNKITEGNVVICAGGDGQCPPDHSCCSVPGSDQVHCCPGGYSCEKGLCQKPSIQFPAVIFTSSAAKIVKCNQEFACPERHTCCKADTSYLCCPFSQAVCCSDQIHCCPRGFKCSPDGKTCSSGIYTLPAFSTSSPMSLRKGFNRLLHLIMAKVAKRGESPSVEHTKFSVVKASKMRDSVVCPDGEAECQSTRTCCERSLSLWSCCPLPEAVCCSDGVHCCPHGYTCDVSAGSCSRESKSIPMLSKLPASKKKPDVNSVVCPDGQSECPDGNTCCKLSSEQWGCCPLPEAVCCSDGVHCCPNGYTCDVSAGSCSQGSRSILILTKLLSPKRKPDVNSIVCPDGQSECPDGNTCCKLASGVWGCCPLPRAVCCNDGIHCCPNGYTCNVGRCSRESKVLPLSEKLPASKRNIEVSSVVCPDGESECPDGNTCCKLSSGQWGCCPLPNAVCCNDGEHCCPHGYTCNVSAGMCSRGHKSTPILVKLPASKRKVDMDSVVCPDGASECPDGNTCCKLSSGEWGCCPLPGAVCCSDGVHCCPNGYTCDISAGTCSREGKSIPMLSKLPASKKKPDVNNVICPDGQSECPDENTCCKLSSGQWGCCPLPEAVCCSDGVHCCPHGYTCDVSAGSCSRESKSIPMLSKLPAAKQKTDVNNVICPDGQSECPDGNTCCKLSSGQWGCCPLPEAVCCSDGVHCCPHGYTCDVSAGSCSRESKSIPMLSKLPASKKKPDVNSVVCPDGQSECPDGNTCCKLSSGQWGCCPLPEAVCCSDGVHCCPHGYTCDVSAGSCSRESKSIPMLSKLPASKRKPDLNSVVCPDGQSECPDGNTCCKLSSGQWGCCPLPEAVCCSDGVHCCPHGYTCDVSAGSCSRKSKSIPMFSKLPASKKKPDVNSVVCPDGQSECPDGNTCCKLSSGQWGCCPLPEAVCCSDGVHCCPHGYTCDVSAGSCSRESKSIPMFSKLPASKKKPDVNSVVCPDGQSECPDGNTCCKLSSGQWGCCPLPEAVCCSDGVHCCPHGYTCDVSAGSCSRESKSIPMFSKLPASKKKPDVNSVVCPDGQSECPDGNTCCKLSSGQWGCCPLPEAVCCSDGVHCCPHGYTCDVSTGSCSQESKIIPLLSKLPASKKKPDVNSVVCPDGQSECPDGNTCCKLSSGQWGCCPLPEAVCCSDGVHCCPHGYTCDVSTGSCSQESKIIPLLSKLPASKKKPDVNSVVCPDGQSECPDGNTCCKLSSGQWGCCPLPEAVCCSDGVHCCPHGYTCDVSTGSCSQESKIIPLLSKLPASKKKPDVNSVVCPDGQSECPDGNTCCKLSSGQWGCCPLPEAVCCSDGVHCCPHGHTCDVSAGTCSQESKIIPMLSKLPASKRKPDVNNVICPDWQSECPDGNTCCKLTSGQWGCCPLPEAVCCSDGVHCCPHGYTCDVSAGSCSRESKSIPMLSKLPASKKKPDVNNVICPDGQSECPDENTCCKLTSGQWGCCPLPEAVCCSDGVHCCPHGYTCDVSAGSCSRESKSIPLLSKLLASKKKTDVNNVICRDGQSECPDGNTCCKLSSGQWGCCPLPEAVCCSDGVHCCPHGYTCDVSAGSCSQKSKIIPMLSKLPASKKKPDVNSVVCPHGQSECPDGNTCCKLSSGQWGCCPLPEAVCCSDGVHCCPHGYTCDVSAGTCSQESKSIPMLSKLPASKRKPDVNNVICPDGQSECPDGNTCCKLSSGQWGCCPLPEAVCCSDGVHCCPHGYTCDVSTGSCSRESTSIPMLSKLPASKKKIDVNNISIFQKVQAVKKTSDGRTFGGITCPDKKYECPNGSTCCKLSSGTYGCCPLEHAVCCSDNKHCCPEGYTCDVKEGKCNKTAEYNNVINSIPVIGTSTDAEVKYINCPDGSTCMDYETCCELPGGEYGCCPMPDAVCCSDHEHCCPCGYRCDVTAEMCVTGNVRLPMMKKMKSARRPMTDHVNMDEKIRFIPGRAQAADDDAVLWLERP